MFPIGLGDRGDAVADVQRRLSALGYGVGSSGVDGVFADETKRAVTTFQASRGLSDTGVVDETTWRSLVEASVKLGDRLLYLRSPYFHGDDVRELQNRLNTLGFNCGRADGVFGRMTERAVRDFQTNTGLPGDGIIGEASLRAMRKLRTILETKSATSLPRRRPKPFSSAAVFKQRAVTIVEPPGEHSVEQSKCGDLAGRLKNLLELLGARVALATTDEMTAREADSGSDVVVGFALDSDRAEPGFAVEAIGPESKALAVAVHGRLSASVTETPDCGLNVGRDTSSGVSIVVVPGSASNEHDLGLLADEAFAQKIAVAVFDGLHSYFGSPRSGG